MFAGNALCDDLIPISLFLFSSLLLCRVQIMPRRLVTDHRWLMEMILRAARLQFNRLPVGVENAQIVRVFWRWLRRRERLDSPYLGCAARHIRWLRIMTVHRTSGAGKFWFGFDFEVWVLFAEGVHSIPNSLTLFLSLSFGCGVDWRERFRADLFLPPYCSDSGLTHFVDDALARTYG